MGEKIINLDDFRKKKKTEGLTENNTDEAKLQRVKAESKSPDESGDFSSLMVMFEYFLTNVKTKGIERILELRVSPAILADSERLVADYTDKEIIDALVESSEQDWVQKPSYYKAMYLEMKKRLASKRFLV
jgi:hypothetical protein